MELLSGKTSWTDIVAEAWHLTVGELGIPSGGEGALFDVSIIDTRQTVMNAIRSADEPVVFSLIEALILLPPVLKERMTNAFELDEIKGLYKRMPIFIANLRIILREHRVSFDIVDGRVVPFESLEIHSSVTVPTLSLLGGRQDLADVEEAYRDALDQIQSGQASSAITKAATALQESLISLGCEGKNLGRLLASARKKGLVSPYDEKLISWVSADRSNKGDAHNAVSASVEDAWLTVHVVGALILRITGGPLRVGDK